MIDQYNNYIVSQINHKVYFQISKITIHYFIVVFFHQINGTLTLNENIADTDGLKKAFYVQYSHIDFEKSNYIFLFLRHIKNGKNLIT